MASGSTVDLSRSSAERWQFSTELWQQAHELLALYETDLGLDAAAAAELARHARPLVPADYWAEMEGLAAQGGLATERIACANLYYDALKLVLGCTAFAVDAPGGPLHARNLDWWTERSLLARHTLTTRFVNGPAGEFVTVGWPGLVGAFSGIAPGRFAVTLNAVLSGEPAHAGIPVVFLLRHVLEHARDFAHALQLLAETPLPSDSLLLLTGTRAGEMVVVERTPTRHALLWAEDGRVCVANDYQALAIAPAGGQSELVATSYGPARAHPGVGAYGAASGCGGLPGAFE